MAELNPEVAYRALLTHDERFDGRLFVGVTSTGIYCRPICPVRPPKLAHCRFFATAAAAAEAGFRPCLRCRPETAPEQGSWHGSSNTVSRGLSLIAQGELDGEDASVDKLAERLGVGERQLRRLFQQHLGASPLTVAQTRRVHFAKQLIHDTRLPMSEVALASGFGSVRRFNETFQQLFGRPPSALRRKQVTALPEGSIAESGVTVRLRYRAPYDFAGLLRHLRERAMTGIEWADASSYLRTVALDGELGTIEVRDVASARCVAATIRFPNVRALPSIVARIRRVFDLGTDVATIGSHLAQDPLLAPLIAARPGLRVPGAWDGFELALRAILGQQVSVEAARRLAVKLAEVCGRRLPPGASAHPQLTLAFPSAADVAAADLSSLGMPGARRSALIDLARAALDDPELFQPLDSIDQTVARLQAIPGIGEWTAQYIALRAVREPDAFPASDVGILRGATAPKGVRPSPRELILRAERWRPFRAYAAQHLWAADQAARQAALEEIP